MVVDDACRMENWSDPLELGLSDLKNEYHINENTTVRIEDSEQGDHDIRPHKLSEVLSIGSTIEAVCGLKAYVEDP